MNYPVAFLLLTTLIPFSASAQTLDPAVVKISAERSGKTIYLNSEYLAYHPVTPESDAKLPLVIYLHGAGGVGEDIKKIRGRFQLSKLLL